MVMQADVAHARHAVSAGSFIRLASRRTCLIESSDSPCGREAWRVEDECVEVETGSGTKSPTGLGKGCALAPRELKG